jgi:hypothetical protein
MEWGEVSEHVRMATSILLFAAWRERVGFSWELNMTRRLKFVIVLLTLGTVCLAQEGLTVQSKGKQKFPVAEAQKIYASACSVVQREFGATRPVMPQVTLVLGADKNQVGLDERQIRLTKWDPGAFAQGVVILASSDVMLDRRLSLTKRALTWADATVDVKELGK